MKGHEKETFQGHHSRKNFLSRNIPEKLESHTQGIKERMLTFEEYQQVFNLIVVELGCPPYSFVSCFASECLRLMKPDTSPPYKKKQPQTSKYFSQFFEGTHFLQAYNNAHKLLLSYDSNRLTAIETICNQPGPARMDMFKTLKALAVLSRVGAHSSSIEERKTFLEESRRIVESFSPEGRNLAEYKYLKGEILYAKQCYIEFRKDFDSAQFYYEDAGGHLHDDLDSLGYFTHPKARLIDILARKGKIEQVHTFSQALLNSQILPLDVESAIENSQERVRTKDFISSSSRQNSVEQQDLNDFQLGLREAFTIDILQTLEELKQIIPLALKKELQKTCDKANYGYRILRKTKYTKKDPNLITSRDHSIFTQIKGIITELENLKNKIDEKRNLQIQNLLTRSIEYYQNYIEDVIQDFKTQDDPDYLQKLINNRAKLLDVNRHIKVQTEDGQKYLLKHLASEKIRVQGPPKDTKYGTHQVTIYPADSNNSVYYKYFPYAPGIQYAVTTLHNEIVPNSAAETMLLRVSDKTGSAIYLASKGVPGRNFSEVIDQQEYIQKLDRDNFSGLFISSLLTRPGDAKPDNLIMMFFTDSNGLKYTQLVSIDDDIAFCSSRLNINHPTASNRTHKIVYADMLNILYLMPQMDQPVSQAIKNRLLAQKPALIVAQWLRKLYQKHLIFEKFLTIPEKDSVRLPIQLPPGTASKIYTRLLAMQNFARTQPMMTHDDYFRTFCPGIWSFYKMSRDNLSMMVSLKNLYAAAGGDPNLVESLCSRNSAISSQAMIGVSASKRMSLKEFKTKFSSSLRKEAERLLSAINFKTLDDQEVEELSQTVSWVTPNDPNPLKLDLELDSLNFTQLQIIYKILKPRSIKLCNPLETRCTELLEECYGRRPDQVAWRNSMTVSFIRRTALKLKNLQDLINCRQRSNENDLTPENLLTTIIENSWDINTRDIFSGDTLLHTAVRNNDLSLVQLLLDCGIDDELRNFDDDKPSDLCLDSDIEKLLIEHHPTFFLNCIEANEVEMALNIAKSISQTRLSQFRDDAQKALHITFQRYQQQVPNENSKELAKILLQKVDKVLDLTLINTCVINCGDIDTELLNLLLNKYDVKSLLYRPMCRELYEAVENACQNRKFKTLVLLVNKGIQFQTQNNNDRVILIAAKWGLKIEIADFNTETNFKYDKRDLETGNTLFHLMCIHSGSSQDPDALFIFEKYKNVLPDYFHSKNNNRQTLFDLAKEYDFINLLEKIYPNPNLDSMYNQDGVHILAKSSKMRELTRLCKRYKLDLSISDIINEFDLDKKFDAKGNTLYQKMMKYSLALDDTQLRERDQLTNDLSCLMIYKPTIIPNKKGNTILHLVARTNDPRRAFLLTENASRSFLEAVNSRGQTCLDIAELYGHDKTAKTLKKRIRDSKHQDAAGNSAGLEETK